MRILWFVLALYFLCGAVMYGQDVPFYPRETKANQDLGGINNNFSDLATTRTSRLTTTVTPDNCPAGQTLTGAYYHNGATVGGACTALAALSATNVFTGSNTFSGPVIFSSSTSFPFGQFKWVHFVGTGTYSIMASYGVSSVAHNGAGDSGDYSIAFSTAWSSANSYSCSCLLYNKTNIYPEMCAVYTSIPPTAGSIRIQTSRGPTEATYDASRVMLQCIGY